MFRRSYSFFGEARERQWRGRAPSKPIEQIIGAADVERARLFHI
jgi:hypothetical protein